MIAQLAIGGIGVLAVGFGVYFTLAADRVVGKNLLSGKKVKRIEELLNRVYTLDEKLAQMRVLVSVLLILIGIFMAATAVSLRA